MFTISPCTVRVRSRVMAIFLQTGHGRGERQRHWGRRPLPQTVPAQRARRRGRPLDGWRAGRPLCAAAAGSRRLWAAVRGLRRRHSPERTALPQRLGRGGGCGSGGEGGRSGQGPLADGHPCTSRSTSRTSGCMEASTQGRWLASHGCFRRGYGRRALGRASCRKPCGGGRKRCAASCTATRARRWSRS